MTIVDHKTRKTATRNAFRFATAGLITSSMLLLGAGTASAAAVTVPLGTVASYSVLGGETVTNTGPSVLSGNLGVSPGSAATGFPPGTVLGETHVADANALQAQADLVIAYDDAAGQTPGTSIAGDLVGQTLVAGVYKASSSIDVTGTLTLDAQDDPNAVFIFQVGSTLTTGPSSTIALINGAQSCHVFWQVGSSAALDTGTTFVGTIMALTSISINTGSTIDGRALARNGSVTLDTDVFTNSACANTPSASPSPSTVAVATPPTGGVQTGDGSTSPGSGGSYGFLYGLSAIAVIAAAVVVVSRSRRRRLDSI